MIYNNKSESYLNEIEEKLKSLKDADELTSVVALSRANEIVKIINTIIEEGAENSIKLYEKARNAYLIAAEKVPKKEKDLVEFPSNYWSLRVKEEMLKARKSSVARLGAIKAIVYPSPSAIRDKAIEFLESSPAVFMVHVRPTSKIEYRRYVDAPKYIKRIRKVDVPKSSPIADLRDFKFNPYQKISPQEEVSLFKPISEIIPSSLGFKTVNVITEWKSKEPVKPYPFSFLNFPEVKLEKKLYEPVKFELSKSIFVSRSHENKLENKLYEPIKFELTESALASSYRSNIEIESEKIIGYEPNIRNIPSLHTNMVTPSLQHHLQMNLA